MLKENILGGSGHDEQAEVLGRFVEITSEFPK
jgi:hypothetical protein